MDRLRPQDPHRIGEYRLLGRLGEGGMGQVYLARSERGRTVAVKTIKGELAAEPDFRRRFADEIAAAQRVGDRWTAPVLDADTDAATPWVATGYIAGPSLHEVVGRDYGPLPERSVALLANGLGHALRAIHGAGLVHRDLKPSNVLMTIDGPRVIDFGIARALEPGPGGGVTRTGATVGSPGFMAPEQVRGQQVTPASDIFCLGSLLAYAATGRTPFGALDSGVHILMFRIAEEEPDLDGLPEALRPLIASCLAKEPERRIGVDELLARTQPDVTSRDPWLPGALVAQLGRHAVALLDSESPVSRVDIPVLPGQPRTDPAPPPPAVPTADPTPRPAAQPGGGSVPPPPGPPGAPSQAAQAAQAAQPSWPGARPAPRPTPLPSPYSMPSGSYLPPSGVGQPGTGGWQAGPAGQGAAKGGGWRDRKAPLAALVASGLVLVVLAVVLVTRLGGSDGNAVDEAYLGVWQGEYSTAGDEARELRFEIAEGGEGELVGNALTLTPEILCAYDVRLDSFDDGLHFTEESNWSVPEGQVTEACRDNSTVQTLRLAEGGEEMVWTYGEQEATLSRGPDRSDEAVPEALLAEWEHEFTDRDGNDWRDVITIEQGAVGDKLLRYVRTEQDDDEVECVWENRLVRVAGEQLTFGPDQLAETGRDATCGVYASIRVRLKEGDQDTLQINWLDALDDDPAEHQRND
ncbi:serine/threonine-protein kinase [Streptomyces sp. DSM 44915]|uniref:Serine/threonine-protein kinase n=1 Tax=Streptomyces chisholmiae TaxID=3075540 RepID=A0ABU2JYM4_9ACTN|nr:serine/threonine-protein kinase [Streptomyces sp. DSM 44915]MDT0270102.1 serine/threonine-protein kinase [Streptomyces sp. DSM 44915]